MTDLAYYTSDQLGAAVAFNSVLSIPYALDGIEKSLAAEVGSARCGRWSTRRSGRRCASRRWPTRRRRRRRGRARRGERAVPLGLARLDGPRPRHRALPARARARARRGRRGGRRRGARWRAGRARDGAVRVRVRRCEQCARRATSRSATASASRLHALGLVRRVVALDWADVNLVALPDAVDARPRPGSAAASPPPTARSSRSARAAGRVGRRARLRRRRAVRGDDRRRGWARASSRSTSPTPRWTRPALGAEPRRRRRRRRARDHRRRRAREPRRDRARGGVRGLDRRPAQARPPRPGRAAARSAAACRWTS